MSGEVPPHVEEILGPYPELLESWKAKMARPCMQESGWSGTVKMYLEPVFARGPGFVPPSWVVTLLLGLRHIPLGHQRSRLAFMYALTLQLLTAVGVGDLMLELLDPCDVSRRHGSIVDASYRQKPLWVSSVKALGVLAAELVL
jgi:hypothetical protein